MDFDILSDDEPDLTAYAQEPETNGIVVVDDDRTGIVEDQDFEMGWSNQQHTQFGSSTNIGTRKSYENNRERYDESLGPILHDIFNNWDTVNHYKNIIHKIPKYWFKNAVALAETLHLSSKMRIKDITPEKLKEMINRHKYKTNMFDLIRYSDLLKKYL